MSLPIPEELREAALRELDKCNKCGFCQTNCPTYLATGVEWEVARGRLSLAKAALKGELDPAELPEAIWSCILCRNCRQHCPPGVEMDRVMVALRAALGQKLGISPLRALIMRGVLPRRGRLAAAATVGSAGQALGLDRMLNLIPDPRARAARAFAPRLASPGALRRAARREGLFSGDDDAPVAVFLGCATEFGMQKVALALGRLLARLGIEARLLDAACCGLPAHSWGDTAGERLAIEANLRVLARGLGTPERPGPIAHVITPCASCASFLNEYPRILAGSAAHAVASRLAEVTEPASVFLGKAGLPELFAGQGGARVPRHTFHDPCHLAHYLGTKEGVRAVLRGIPGGGFVEMAESDSCCGGGGSYALTHPDHAAAVFERKLERIKASGATTVSTICPVCLLQLQRGLEKAGSGVRAVHLLELAWDSLSAGGGAAGSADAGSTTAGSASTGGAAGRTAAGRGAADGAAR